MSTLSAGLVKVNNLTVAGAGAGAVKATTVTATNLTAGTVNALNFGLENDLQVIGSIDVSGNVTVGNNLVTPLLTVNNIQGTTDLNNQLLSIQYAVGADPDASISDQDALKEMNFLPKLMANFGSALDKYLADPTDETVVPIFTGAFNYINPTDGSGYVGQIWKGDYNPLVQNYFGPSGEEMRAVDSLGFDILTYSIISIAFLVKFNTESSFINCQTPFYRKYMEEYDNPSLLVNFRVSMYNMVAYQMKTMREALDPTDTEQASYISLLVTTEVLFQNELTIVNNIYQPSGNPTGADYYYNPPLNFDNFIRRTGFTLVADRLDNFGLPFPFVDIPYLFGVNPTPSSPEWQGAVANNSVKYFKAFAKYLSYWARAFEEKQPFFHKYINGAVGSTLGFTDSSNVFQYYNPISENTTTEVKYRTKIEGGIDLYQPSFSTACSYNINDDSPFTGINYPAGLPITGIFSLPAKWWDFLRMDYSFFIQDITAMYNYLLTLDGGQAVIDAVQVVWENEVLPASADCYNQYKQCKINNTVDDEYTGPWRNYINKEIDHIDVVNTPYTVYFKDSTTIPLNNPEILKAVREENSVLALMICAQSTGSVSAFTKQDSSMNYTNYTSYQGISDNYSIVNIPISIPTPEILSGSDTISKTCAQGVFESGIEFAKYFDDLESYSIYTGLGNGSIQIPLYPGGPNLQQNQFNTDLSGTVWDIQKVYDEFLTTIGKTKSDWTVLGYYYGRHPTDPLYNVYNPVIFDGPVDASGYATDSSGNNVYQRRALQGGNNQYVLEGGHSGSDASGWDNINNVYQLVYDGSGATPYRSTRTRVALVAAPLTGYVVRANYDPVTIPVCLDFDYCLIEHYKINTVTGYPNIIDNSYEIVSSTNFINGTRGNRSGTSVTNAVNRDTYRFRSFANQVDNRVFLCWYNFMINRGKAATYKDASNNDTSGNGIYSPNMIRYIKNNYFFLISEGYNTSSSAASGVLPDNLVGQYSWYSDTFGCEGAGYSGPASIPGRKSYSNNNNGTQNPQESVRSQYNMTIGSHEIFGHGIQFAYPSTQYTSEPVPWTTPPTQPSQGVLTIRNGFITDDLQGGYYFLPYNAAVIGEGYATIMEIMCTKFGLYRSANLTTIDMGNNVDSFVVLYALLNLSRIVARLLIVAGNGDPTASSGKGDVSSYPWIARTVTEIQKILNMDTTQRLLWTPNQMVTYAIGLINNLNVINQILATSFPTDPENFKQYNYDYWRITETNVLTGDAVLVAALAKPRSFWVDEIEIPNNP